MMVENILNAQGFEWQSGQENIVWRIAALNDMKSVPQIDPPGI
jgi:hypothetical protein